eukprot:g519.t1
MHKLALDMLSNLATENNNTGVQKGSGRVPASQKVELAQCPKCHTPFEVTAHNWITARFSREANDGLDNRPLSADAQRHYLANRFRCRMPGCDISFCRLCQSVPYHSGFDCDSYRQYRESRKCKFCLSIEDLSNDACELELDRADTADYVEIRQAANDPSEPLVLPFYVCLEDTCRQRALRNCRRTLACGHACSGIRGELPQDCPPCLLADCLFPSPPGQSGGEKAARDLPNTSPSNSFAKLSLGENREGLSAATSPLSLSKQSVCVICAVADLAQAPCLVLRCGHIFHQHCLEKQIKLQWKGDAIHFKCCRCPLCAAWLSHPSLRELLEPLEILRDKVYALVRTRMV